jgi:hypothetical protein
LLDHWRAIATATPTPYSYNNCKVNIMSLTLERELQLKAAELSLQGAGEAELKAALVHAWTLLLSERDSSSALLSDALGVEVKIGGPLLPPTLRQEVR